MHDDLRARDQKVNWHPYTQMKGASAIVPIVRAEGTYLYDNEGKRYIDAVSSWWVTLHGHAHPYIADRVYRQLNTLEQVIFAGFTHEPAIQLAENLLKLLPSNQEKVFYTDNGSTAVEVALKMCVQYHANKGHMHKAEDLNMLMNYCRQKGILMIQDEIFVGFGRTGKLFAADHLTEYPDVMCFSKGLTGGTMPLGLTTCSSIIYDAFYADDKKKALYHGHSFTANPLACAAALASMELLLKKETRDRITAIEQKHQTFLAHIVLDPKVKYARQTGTILAIELQQDEKTSYFSVLSEVLYPYFLSRGILIRPLGNIIYLVPPYCISDDDLDYIYTVIIDALQLY
ncbi:aminotransferase class III-fold pyridoxal phosphate-dependent enzyme [Sphingobacterium faecium]|uniref:aminotransferase class III-fold pyridoxal phosphate-dependent enzyme n=1 Tax=Sphingobacterium faecium TaxID=34087 RepID=UPI00247AD391|nr:aminotransferase class III-fold pyridoxal phosphate-dependent enzyme [Sphingobacterium faecium]WGQ16865.1 aminotransferase class III-fold pyridoxal phosphate-dependent enzyme [Sphingobacterium faecium]